MGVGVGGLGLRAPSSRLIPPPAAPPPPPPTPEVEWAPPACPTHPPSHTTPHHPGRPSAFTHPLSTQPRSDLEEDAALLKSAACAVLVEVGAGAAHLSDDLVGEAVRAGGGELHCVAALLGAAASQEAIKLLTGTFLPVPGALLYDAARCTTAVLAL